MKIPKIIVTIVGGLSIYLVFRHSIILLLQNSYASTWLLKINDDVLTISIFGFWILSIIIYYLWKIENGRISSNKWFYFLLFISSIYFIERILFASWNFFPRGTTLKYFDLLFLVLFFETVNIFNARKSDKPKTNNSIFELERPLKDTNQDSFHRKEFAQRIADEINKSHFDEAFSIAIIGQWSSGKSSFLQFISCNLHTDKIVIEFKPWLNYDSQGILKNFFSILKSALSQYDSNLNGLFEEYYKSLSNLDTGLYYKIISTIGNSNSDGNLNDEFDAINRSLKLINKQVIVIIDDLDRLDSKEIVEIFKLIRNTANFYNTIYITAFDRTFVTNAVKTLNELSPNTFINKIFDFEFVLPEVNREYVITEINTFLSSGLGLTQIIKTHSPEGELIKLFITNKRDLRRFKNHLKINWTELNKELVFEEILILELIRSQYPQVITLFFASIKKVLNWADFTSSEQIYNIVADKDGITAIQTLFAENETSSSTKFHLSIDSIQLIVQAFQFLFADREKSPLTPVQNVETPTNSIRRKAYLEIYFSLLFSPSAIKIQAFHLTLELPWPQFKSFLNEHIFSEPVGFKPLLLLELIRKSPEFYQEKKRNENTIRTLLTLESNEITVDPNLLLKLFDQSTPLDDNKKLFRQLFLSRDFHEFSRSNILARLIRASRTPYSKLASPLSVQELIDLNEEIFFNHLQTMPKVSNALMSLYYANYVETDSNNNYVLNEKVTSHFCAYIKSNGNYKDFLNLLSRPRGTGVYENEFGFAPYWNKLFGDVHQFKNFLTNATDYIHQNLILQYLAKLEANDYAFFALTKDEIIQIPDDFINMNQVKHIKNEN